MKILHITATHLNPTGGIGTVIRKLSYYQNKLQDIESKVLSLTAAVDGFDSSFLHIPMSSTDLICNFLDSYKPDIAIIHGFYCFEYSKMGKLLSQKRIKYLLEPHGSFGKMANQKSSIKKKFANFFIFRKLIRNASGIVFTNPSEKSDSIIHNQNEMIIRNGVDLENKHISFESKSRTTPILFYLGRFDIHHKGLDYLFDALDVADQKKADLIIHIYGSGNDFENSYVKERASKLKYVKCLIFGNLLGKDKERTLNVCNVMVLTSRYEGSPISILDALEYGCPCIVTPGTNVSKELTEYGIGWEAKLDSNSIANALLSAVNEYQNNFDEYGNRIMKYFKELCDMRMIAVESIREYEKIIKQGGQNNG